MFPAVAGASKNTLQQEPKRHSRPLETRTTTISPRERARAKREELDRTAAAEEAAKAATGLLLNDSFRAVQTRRHSHEHSLPSLDCRGDDTPAAFFADSHVEHDTYGGGGAVDGKAAEWERRQQSDKAAREEEEERLACIRLAKVRTGRKQADESEEEAG